MPYTGANTSHLSLSLLRNTKWMDVVHGCTRTLMLASGVSFLPHSDHTYQQAPYQDIEPDEYTRVAERMNVVHIDWENLAEFEKEDNTSGSQGTCLFIRGV